MVVFLLFLVTSAVVITWLHRTGVTRARTPATLALVFLVLAVTCAALPLPDVLSSAAVQACSQCWYAFLSGAIYLIASPAISELPRTDP
jgi:hypothetical protein